MPIPPVVYATYIGVINQEMVGRMVFHISGGIQQGMRELHLMFQSVGGTVGDGLALFSYFSACPVSVHLYNGGAVDSAAVIAYLGAANRYVSAHGTFLLHPTSFASPMPMGAQAHRVRAKSLEIDDKRTRDVLKARTNLPQRLLSPRFDETLTAQEAIDFGIAQSIRDFQVPAGNPIFDLTQQRP